MIWCRCNAHLVESDDDQTPDVECCGCRGKRLQAARRRWFAARAEKPNAPDCSEASASSGSATAVAVPFVQPWAARGRATRFRAEPTMPDAHRDVKPKNTPPPRGRR